MWYFAVANVYTYYYVLYLAGDWTKLARYIVVGWRAGQGNGVRLKLNSPVVCTTTQIIGLQLPMTFDTIYTIHTRAHGHVYIGIYPYIFFFEPPLAFQTCPAVTNSQISGPAAKSVTLPPFKTMWLRWSDDVLKNDEQAFQKHSTRSHSSLPPTSPPTTGQHPFTATPKISI